jgi:hypoxanthine-guanine phosphoribosyltransferase
VQLCTLLDRRSRHILPLQPDYVGMLVDEDFLVGYGLDLAEAYRNLPGLFRVDPSALAADPATGIAALYGEGAEGSAAG